jgi:hypothetical protein
MMNGDAGEEHSSGGKPFEIEREVGVEEGDAFFVSARPLISAQHLSLTLLDTMKMEVLDYGKNLTSSNNSASKKDMYLDTWTARNRSSGTLHTYYIVIS